MKPTQTVNMGRAPQLSGWVWQVQRDQIKQRAEADFLQLFEEHGGKRRGKALFCFFHKNERTPAASIHKGRFRCFSCNLTLDVFEFIQRVQHTTFRAALEYLGHRYGVPPTSSARGCSDAERRAWAQQHERDRTDLIDAFHWHRAALQLTDEALSDLSGEPWEHALEVSTLTKYRGRLVAARTEAQLLDEFRWMQRRSPELTAAVVAIAQEWDLAEQMTLARLIIEIAGEGG